MHCPKCAAENTVIVRCGLRARPIGTFSLAGAQMKFSVYEVAIATCTECDLHLVGHLETSTDPESGLYFVVDTADREGGAT